MEERVIRIIKQALSTDCSLCFKNNPQCHPILLALSHPAQYQKLPRRLGDSSHYKAHKDGLKVLFGVWKPSMDGLSLSNPQE
jgi:hypothetical protein